MDISYLSRHYCMINTLKAELNPICHLLALLGGATIVVVSRLRVKLFVFDTCMLSSLHHEWKGWPSEIRNIIRSQHWTRSAVQMSFKIRLQAYIFNLQNCWLMKRHVCCLTCRPIGTQIQSRAVKAVSLSKLFAASCVLYSLNRFKYTQACCIVLILL